MNHNEMYGITPEFWRRLSEIRAISRLVLVALEEDDVEEVERLSRDSEKLMAEIRPVIEAREKAMDRNEDDRLLKGLLGELATMNRRILEEIDLRREALRQEIAEVRSSRLRLVHYRSARERDPELVNLER